ncbi:hypothetical protein U0070_023136 [Myodes glareolus]|uniref:Uncharacterized protein n=1 Tax=Myodes glareolus TaxID=447135 RepID=A0AAW0HTT5_MYOGA
MLRWRVREVARNLSFRDSVASAGGSRGPAGRVHSSLCAAVRDCRVSELLGPLKSLRLQDLLLCHSQPCSASVTLEEFGSATKKHQNWKLRGAMAADTNFQQKIQPLAAEEQRGACEVRGREFRLGSSGQKGRPYVTVFLRSLI